MSRTTSTNLFDQLPHGYRIDRRLGVVYDHAPSAADDLTAIRGIGTREAVILNRLGVYYHAQIALWQPAEIVGFADEAGMNVSTLLEEQWTEQARLLCRPRPTGPSSVTPHLPASVVRTVSLLACAMLVGCLVVYWLSMRSNAPLRGVLSADITSIRVPAESRLMAAHVEPGQEVFSGETLLTLEKTEHLAMISLQERRVLELGQQLEQAEAQAALDLAWRTRELDRELADVRTRAHLIQEVKRTSPEPFRSASLTPIGANAANPKSGRNGLRVHAVSRTAVLQATPRPRKLPQTTTPNGMVFIGASGESTIGLPTTPVVERPQPLPEPAIPTPVKLASEPNAEEMLNVEAQSVELRLARLEELRNTLPDQVRRAAGVEGIRVQYDEAAQRLKEMQTLSRDIAVLCPAYGKVGQVRYKAGDTMSQGEIMLKILHSDRRYVVLNVPTRRVNEIEPGMFVDLIFPGDDYYRGRVSNLPMLAETTLPSGQSLVTVRVEPTGRLWPEIPVGSQIDVLIDDRG